MGESDVHWRIADCMAQADRWQPEASAYATGYNDARDRGQVEFYLSQLYELNEWSASWTTWAPRRARLGTESLKRALKSRKYRFLTRDPRGDSCRLYGRDTSKLRVAFDELRWISRVAHWRGQAPSPASVAMLAAGSATSPLDYFWRTSSAMRQVGANPYFAVYRRRSSLDDGETRGWIEHSISVRPGLQGWLGTLVYEVVSCALWGEPELPRAASIDGHSRLAPLARQLHQLGFHGQWSWDGDSARFAGTFHGPQRPLHHYFTVGSPFYRVGAKLDRIARTK